jgi:carbon monoxide dehydrogenase subunit G
MTHEMATWQTTTTVNAEPEDVLEVLTDPSSARRWSPIGFELEELEGDRLRSGTRAVLSGKLAGRGVSFDVHVIKASDGQLELRAVGPVEMDVAYDAVSADEGTEVKASVEVRSAGGLMGRVLSSATDALLAGGALAVAVQGVAREVERSHLATC